MTVGKSWTTAGLRTVALAALCLAGFAVWSATARAERPLLNRHVLQTEAVPGGDIEGACGVALLGGQTYVSDYYHHAVDVFDDGGVYRTQIADDPADGPCGLAGSAGGALYVNDWHAGVERLLPSPLGFDEAESTGVAVDQTDGRVYVDDRTYVAVYEPSGAAVEAVGGGPLRVGIGSLLDGYGVAVSAGRVYVADAGSGTVKVYEPAIDTLDPVQVIDGAATPQRGFSSLVDAALAVDLTEGHLLVLDNLQPGFEYPEAAIDEFDATGAFVGQVAQRVIDGEPSGMTTSNGYLYVTSGNDAGANMFKFGPYSGFGLSAASVGGAAGAASSVAGTYVTSAAPAVAGNGEPRSDRPAPPALLRLAGWRAVGGRAVSLRLAVAAPGMVAIIGHRIRRLRRRVEIGRVTLRLRLDRAGRRALARGAGSGRLKVAARVSFAAAGLRRAKVRKIVEFDARRRRRL